MKGGGDASRTASERVVEPGPGDARAPSRAAKVWRRTRVGGALCAVLALAFWLVWRSEDGAAILLIGAVLALGAAHELDRMARPRGLELLAPLFAALAGAVWVGYDAVRAVHWRALVDAGELAPERAAGLYEPDFWREAVYVALLALAAGGLARLVALAPPLRSRAPWIAVVALLLVLLRGHVDALDGLDHRRQTEWTIAALALLGLLLPPHAARRERALAALAALWVVLPLAGLAHVWRGFGPQGLLALVLLSKVGDVLGYYVGSAIGRHHPFPRTSPGKTTEGCLASLAGALVAGGALALGGLLPASAAGPLGGVVAGVLAGGVVNLASQAGDLLESRVKRRAGVKDSGSWFGPSGGVLDLVDSLLLSVPAALLLWPLLFPAA